MFSKYYQSELTYLRDLGNLFGKANPTIASLLAERSTDPDVERLLEGFAFLSARTRERIDDAVPEIVHALAELLVPHYLRTLPAATILEFSPQLGALRGRHTLPRGTQVASIPIEGTSCTFRTTADVDLLPLTLEDVILDQSSATSPVLRLRFDCAEKALPSVFEPAGIRLFLSGDHAGSSVLLLWLLRYCKSVRIAGQTAPGVAVTLPADVIRPSGFPLETSLIPWPEFAPPGFRMLQEYFTLPAKFLFVDVTQLDDAVAAAQERFELAFQFEKPPQLTSQLGRQSLRLHCTPAVNLFDSTANPIRKSLIEHEHLLTAADIDPAHMEIYSVRSVTGIRAEHTERRSYHPFEAFTHAEGENDAPFYSLRKVASPIDGGVDTYFSLVTPRDRQPDMNEETFSIEVTCTNRLLAGELRPGDVREAAVGSPAVATFRNITAVTKAVRPPLGEELVWRLISHLSLNRTSLARADSLAALVGLYNFHDHANLASGRANRMRAEAIRAVETVPGWRLVNGAPVRGAQTRVELQEEKFASEGDVFLFGCVLDDLLADHISLNAFNQLVVRLEPSQGEYQWPARAGSKTIL